MATAPSPISLDEYMNTSYSPDCEYIDGLVMERNVGKGKHSYTQLKVGQKLLELCESRGLFVLTEQRTRISEYRVRIPDVSVVEELAEVTVEPPRRCVEILSPDDRWSRVNPCIADYQAMGVLSAWVVDPYERRAWIFEFDKPPLEVHDGKLRSEELGIEINLADVLPPAN